MSDSRAARTLRPLPQRLLSLKSLSRFTVYQCLPHKANHTSPELDLEARRALVELYRDFCVLDMNYGDRWLDWIHWKFNNGSLDPEDGTLSLQLVLRWSPLKIVFWGITPIFLSLAVGFRYMFKSTPGEDFLTVVQTAWSIASYIITAAALALAVLAAVTQIGNA